MTDSEPNVHTGNWVATLRRFVWPPPPAEYCELCSEMIPAEHPHLIEPRQRRLLCACEACALLFAEGGSERRYRRVPRTVRRLDDFRMSDGDWDALLIPIDMAFFFHSSPDGRVVAMYPGPAGATESMLGLDAWQRLTGANPVLDELEPDVEALLVNRMYGARDCYRVPIDHCYALVGLIRRQWVGLSGGTEVWRSIRDFFDWLHGEPRDQSGRGLGQWGHA